jgi:hypothetical protein
MFRNADVEKTQAPIPGGQIGLDPRADRLRDEVNMCSRPMTSEEIVAEFFKYHPPNDSTIPKFAAINQAAKNFAEVVLANCPSGWDRRDAINSIRKARMVANAAIALDGLSL